MRQLLILGFHCEVYRREPRCRVYVNDILLDEFNIPQTTSIDTRTYTKLDPVWASREQFELESNTLFLKYLEFDHLDEKSLDIRIEISNDDNNHTNGFMTRYTRMILAQCWVAPVKVWEQFDKIYDRWKFSLHNLHRWQNSTNYIAQYYSGQRNYVFDNLVLLADMHFPDIELQPCSDQQKKDRVYNYEHHPRMWQMSPSEWCIGSSGYIHLPLTKKLGFWRHRDDRRRGWWKWSKTDNAKNLYDKYKQYEDTRSIDQ